MVWTHTTNIGQDRGWMRNLIRYATNENKTENGRFCEFVNCTPDTATEYFELLLNQKNYLSGRELKGGVFHTIISHELPNDEISDEKCEKFYKDQDIKSVKEWVTQQGKNPDDYAFLYAGHRDTNREDDHGQFHGHIVLLAVNINNISAPLIRDDKANRYLLQDVVMQHFPNETTITRNFKKEMEYRRTHPKEKFSNREVTVPESATPDTHILISQSAKRRWEYIISNANMSPTMRKRELLKTDIDDAIETIKDNYHLGKSKFCDYKSFLKEMNKRGYSYRQNKANSKAEYLKFTHKSWSQTVRNGKTETVYYQFKERGYSKTDIEKRMDFKMDFTPQEPSVYVWNDIEKMPKNKRLRQQAEYINFCNVRKACRCIRFIDYLFGGGWVGLIAALLLAFLLKATLPTSKEIYKQINENDYNRRIQKNVVYEPKTPKQPTPRADESRLESENEATINADSNQTVTVATESGAIGLIAPPEQETADVGFTSAENNISSAVGLTAEDVKTKDSEFLNNQNKLEEGKEMFYKEVYKISTCLMDRNSYPKNTIMRKEKNNNLIELCRGVGEEYPSFKKYIEEDLLLDFKPKNICELYKQWAEDYSEDADLLEPLKKYDNEGLNKLTKKQKEVKKPVKQPENNQNDKQKVKRSNNNKGAK